MTNTQERPPETEDQGTGRPLGGSYSAAVAMALLALSPFIVLSTATVLVQQQIVHDLHTSRFIVTLADSLANAAYAFGAVAGADFIKRFPARRLYQGSEVSFIVGSLLCGLAGGESAFLAGRILQGFGTGILLVAALPPLVQRFGVGKLPVTVAVIDLGLFGMVTIGPLIGGYTASFHDWRGLFFIVGGLALVAVVLAQFAFEGSEDAEPTMPLDPTAIPLAIPAAVLPFFGVTWIARGGFHSPGFYVPILVGLIILAILIVRQYRKRDSALMPLDLIAHTLPITGILAAMVAGAAVTALLELSAQYLTMVAKEAPTTTGIILTSEVLGLAIAAVLFGVVIRTRWLAALSLAGVGVVGMGGAFLIVISPPHAVLFAGMANFLIGFGAGAGVAPALFMAGLSAPSSKLGPTFALVELLRSESAYLVAPVLLQVAMLYSNFGHGIQVAAIISTAVCAVGGALALAILLAGGTGPHAPDLQTWLDGEEPAYDSPPFAAALRGSSKD